MTRRIIDNLIDDQLSFVLVGDNSKKNTYIQEVLNTFNVNYTVYSCILYEYLHREILTEHGNISMPIVYIDGKYVGGIEEVNEFFGINNGIYYDFTD